jgi:tetratricopeptide (TPR) repeat protein
MGQGVPNQTQIGAGGAMTDELQYGTIGHRIEHEEYQAYQAFLKAPEPAEKIKRGTDFLKKYPKSTLAESVDVGMMNAYVSQKDWKDSYRFGNDALALAPDDVDVLTTIGWTIPHVYNPTDPDASAQLDKAEKYAMRALEVMATMKKPAHVSDAQFADAKAKRTFEAHSALGLVYFRRQQYDDSAKEAEQAVQGNPTPDPTDLFVLGADLHFLNRHAESADAFSRCARITSTLQEHCKQNAGAEKLQAAPSQAK